jgi:hypothetical protein
MFASGHTQYFVDDGQIYIFINVLANASRSYELNDSTDCNKLLFYCGYFQVALSERFVSVY